MTEERSARQQDDPDMETRGRKPNDGRGRLGGRQKGTPNRRYKTHTVVSYLRADRPERRGRKANDGRGRLGGRGAKTPNKVTEIFWEVIAAATMGSPEKVDEILRRQTPKIRPFVFLKIIGLLYPKPRPITLAEAMEEMEY